MLMDDLTGFVRSMTRAGLRRLHPDATEEALDERFAELVLGKDLAARVRQAYRDRVRRSRP